MTFTFSTHIPRRMWPCKAGFGSLSTVSGKWQLHDNSILYKEISTKADPKKCKCICILFTIILTDSSTVTHTHTTVSCLGIVSAGAMLFEWSACLLPGKACQDIKSSLSWNWCCTSWPLSQPNNGLLGTEGLESRSCTLSARSKRSHTKGCWVQLD